MRFLEEDKIKSNTTYKELVVRIWPYIAKHKFLFFFVMASILGLAGISRVLPYLIGYTIDHGFKEKSLSVIQQMAWLYLFFEILKMIFSFLHKYLFQKLGIVVLGDLRRDLLAHVQKLPMDYYHKNPSGRIVTRMTNDIATLSEVFSEGVVSLFSQLSILVSIIIAMALISWKITLITLATTPLFIYMAYYLSEKIKVILRDQKKKLSELNSFMSEHFSGIKVAQLYNQIKPSEDKFFNLSVEYRTLNMKSIKAYALMQPTLNLMNAAVIGSALFWAGKASLENSLALGAVVSFVLNAQDIIPPIRDVIEKYQMFQNSLTSAERVFALLDEKIEDYGKSGEKNISQKIKIQNLNFKYAAHLPWAVHDLSLNVPAGTSLALVGRTGSGKTTLVSLLQRFYEPTRGQIYFGDSDILDIQKELLRSQIGVIQQDPFIFKGTILTNITLGDSKISSAQVLSASEQIGFLEYLAQSRRDIHALVEEKGSNLSLGERQVISFLRMMVREPQVLILDEATANIDSLTESLIQTATEKILKNRTSIIIAHRLSTIKACDQIAVLKQGQLIELGNHNQLVAKQGYYYKLSQDGFSEIETTDPVESRT